MSNTNIDIFNPNEITLHSNTATEDLDLARKNILNMISTSQASIEEIYQSAFASQHHLNYQALNNLMKTHIDANRELVELHTKLKEVVKEDPKQVQNIQNNLYVGTSADLLKLIRQAQEEPKE